MDEAVPSRVKGTYSPRESWKDKPFSKEDARFFSKGVHELSDQFTEERERKVQDYFAHPKYRSSYLLYFLPLQAAKFVTLFELYPEAMKRGLDEAKRSGVLRVADFGAGPGTASIALMLWLLEQDLPADLKIELHWVDLNRAILEDGRALVETLSSHFPKLRGKVSVHLRSGPWWEFARELEGETTFAFMGNVLNEAPGGPLDFSNPRSIELWAAVAPKLGGSGLLLVEPAMRRASQLLSRLRNELLQRGVLPETPGSLWGPCLHAGRCPLSEGRDWCHVSMPTQVPGQWFRNFSEGLGSERNWLKFAYLWLASAKHPAPEPRANARRVISDPLNRGEGRGPQEVLICEPERPGRARVSGRVHRGDVIER
jgi:hypothetical protein